MLPLLLTHATVVVQMVIAVAACRVPDVRENFHASLASGSQTGPSHEQHLLDI
jgi:hypothetical protein